MVERERMKAWDMPDWGEWVKLPTAFLHRQKKPPRHDVMCEKVQMRVGLRRKAGTAMEKQERMGMQMHLHAEGTSGCAVVTPVQTCLENPDAMNMSLGHNIVAGPPHLMFVPKAVVLG